MKTKLLFLAILALSLWSCKKETPLQISMRNVVEELHRDMVNKHVIHNLTQLQLQDQQLSKEIPLLSMDRENNFLENIISEQPLLVFRYSEIHCNSCVDQVVQQMNRLWQDGKRNMALIASYDEYQHFTSFVRANKLQMPTYLLQEEEAKGVFDSEIPPYLFLLDQSLAVKYPFVPIKEMDESIQMYMDFIQHKI